MARILITDDAPQINRLIEKALEPMGHEIRNVDSLEEAVAMTERQGFDLVFFDLVLPDGYGLDSLPAFMNGAAPRKWSL